jgi:predicted DNA-binding transcriptional regulator YafY
MQKSERLNAAHRLIAQGIGMTEAAMMLARDYGLSRRQAYRYVEEAQTLVRPAPVAEASTAVTFKLPVSVVHKLRAHAAAHNQTLSSTVSRAISQFLQSEQ